MICSCGNHFAASTDTYVGTQLFPFAAICLFNCPECFSTRGVCVGESETEEIEAVPESIPLAAE